MAASRAGGRLPRRHRLLSDARHAPRLRHPRRRRRRDGRRHHPGRHRLRHLVRRAVSARARAHGRRRRRRGQAAPLGPRGRIARRDRRRQPPAARTCRASASATSTRSSATARKASGVDADLCERQYIAVDDAALDLGPHRPRPRQGVAAARLRRRRQPLHRDAGRPRRRLGLGHDPLRHPRLRLADGESLLLRRRRAARPAEEPPRGLVAARRRAARARVLGASQLGRELRRREPAHHRARRAGSARGRLRRDGRGVLRDLAQPRAGGDARAARRPHAARLRASQGRDARVPGGPSRSRRHAVGDDGSPVPHPGLDVRRRRDPVPLAGAYGSGCSVNHGAGPRDGARRSEARARAAASTRSIARCATSRARSAA